MPHQAAHQSEDIHTQIICDVDGVVAALHDEWYRRYNKDYDDNLTLERVLSWDLHKYVKPECGKKVYDYLHQSDLYDNIQPLPDALWGITRLRELGHEVLFATSCTFGMADQKAEWMVRNGFCTRHGHLLPEDFVPITPKHWLSGDLIIDDAAHTVQRWVQGKGGRAILFEYPHNQHLLKDMPSMFWMRCKRASDWKEVVRHVEAMSR